MRKFLAVLEIIIGFLTLQAQDCPFKVRFSVVDATCFNNGKVCYSILDEYDQPITDITTTGLSQVRIYHRLHENDSAQYSISYYLGGVDTLQIDYGTYFVGVEALCSDGHGGYIKKDTQTVLTINTSYAVPTASAIYVTAYTEEDFGRHPSLNCLPTGRIQLVIENGRFPYNITIVNHNDSDDTLRTDTITHPQYTGTDASRYDFKDYYSMDSLPAGEWDFYLQDGCGYGLPRTGQVVEVVSIPILKNVEVYAASDNMLDSNIIRINSVLNSPYEYYIHEFSDSMEYRFSFDGVAGPWRPYPTVSTVKTLMHDTIEGIGKYCDIWEKNISFDLHVRCAGCADTIVSRTFQYHAPNTNRFTTSNTELFDSVASITDCSMTWFYHKDEFSIRYRSFNPSHTTANQDDEEQRYHFTHPLVWYYSDAATNDIIARETVSRISDASKLLSDSIINYYHLPLPVEKEINRKLVDAHGCVLYDKSSILPFDTLKRSTAPSWSMEQHGNSHCCQTMRTITLQEQNSTSADLDGTVIRLVKSPYDNLYNFEATYSSATHDWTITRSHLENIATINGATGGRSLLFGDYCLPSGPYQFEITTPCGSYTVSKNIAFADIYSTQVTEEPVFSAQQQCTDQYITYTAGQFSRISRNTDPATGTVLTDIATPLTTYFQVIEGPDGGYDSQLHTVGQQIRISMPGTYIVKIFPEHEGEMCELVSTYDTIQYGGATVQFEYAYAFLCDNHDTQGSVRIRGFNGTGPYTYALYSEADLQGTLLGSNSTGTFDNVPMTSSTELSCLITDDCGAYFYVNFFPQALADLQKTWFDGGLRATTTCEGSTIQIHALEIANIFEYEWSGPNGFHSNSANPYVFIPHGAESGWYRVDITQTGCQDHICDSIYLGIKRAATLTLSGGSTYCPGEEIHLTFTPDNLMHEGAVDFTMAFSNSNGIETRNYRGLATVPISDTYTTLIPTKIYPISITDTSECGYTVADPLDTIYIYTSTNRMDPCQLITQYDTACFGETGHLTAKATVTPPYTIRWYQDYNLTQLLKEEVITDGSTWSSYDTSDITQRTILFASAEKDGQCPTVNGIATSTIYMAAGSTTLNCADILRLYDSGGPTGTYTANETVTHTFQTMDGNPVSILFEELNLSHTSTLFVLSGTTLHPDSVLVTLSYGSSIPEIITSRSNELTLYFLAGMEAGTGWSALVQRESGIAIADIYPKIEVSYHDEVCQSQTNTYADPYHIAPDVASAAELNDAIHHSGVYSFSKTLTGASANGCDSIVHFTLTVGIPAHHEETVVTTTMHGGSFSWHGNTYNTTGQYTHTMQVEGGCDSVDILNLIVLVLDTSTNDICLGDSTTMGVSVTTPEINWGETFPLPVAIGDVLCTDGAVLRPEAFLTSGKTPKGVVFYINPDGQKAKAIALTDAHTSTCCWAPNATIGSINSLNRFSSTSEAIMDMDGMGNTEKILENAARLSGFTMEEAAPAAYYAYYYDHITATTGTTPCGWHLPSTGELNVFYGNRLEVYNTLKILRDNGYTTTDFPNISSARYWSSNSWGTYTDAFVLTYSGHIKTNRKFNYDHFFVRSVIDFTLPITTTQIYHIGDLFTFPDGSQGVICHIDPNNGQKGWAVALNDLPESYEIYTGGAIPASTLPYSKEITTFNMTEGWPDKPMERMQYLRDSHLSPAADAVDFYNGWYIPDALQLRKIYGTLYDTRSALVNNGGTLPVNGDYWSTSKQNGWYYYILSEGSGQYSYDYTLPKHIRPIRNFGVDAHAYWEEKFADDGTKSASMVVKPTETSQYNAVVVYGTDTFRLTGTARVRASYDRDTIYENVTTSSLPYTSVNDTNFKNIDISIPHDDYYTYRVTLQTQEGCDSTITLMLKVKGVLFVTLYDTICVTELPLTWHDTVFQTGTVSGDYPIFRTSSSGGLDSIITLNLYIKPYINASTFTLTCPSDTTVTLAYGDCDTLLGIGNPTYSYDASLEGVPFIITHNAPVDSIYRTGTRLVTWTVTDGCGVSLSCEQRVTITYPPCGTTIDSVSDYDGFRYSSVRIGCQCWTGENLRSTHYYDGTPVAAYHAFNDNDSLEAIYGKLYSWYTAVRVPEGDNNTLPTRATRAVTSYVQGICPDGWAVPTLDEYMTLLSDAGGSRERLKEASTLYWIPGYEGTLPNSGFDARGAGNYNADNAYYQYENLMVSTSFWTADSDPNSQTATAVIIPFECGDMDTDFCSKRMGYSVRCIRKK